MGNKAYSTEGVEEANLDDLETKLSMKDRKVLLKERIKKYQEELEKLEAEDEYGDYDWEDITAKHKMNIRFCRDGESVRAYCIGDSGKEYRLY